MKLLRALLFVATAQLLACEGFMLGIDSRASPSSASVVTWRYQNDHGRAEVEHCGVVAGGWRVCN